LVEWRHTKKASKVNWVKKTGITGAGKRKTEIQDIYKHQETTKNEKRKM